MSLRELVCLGTASQVPTRFRNHNGYLLLWDGRGVLFDPGEGTQRQMIFAGVSATDVTRICLSHFHGDHCLGLPGVIQRLSLDGVPHTVTVHYPASGQAYFDRLRRASIFRDKSKLEPKPTHANGLIHQDSTLRIHTRRLDHAAVEAYGYRLVEPDDVRMDPAKLQALGLRGPIIGALKRNGRVMHEGREISVEEVSEHKPGQKVAFIMDTRVCDACFELADGVDLLICESTYLASEQREARQRGHMTATDAATIAKQAGVRTLVLTQFSQRYGRGELFAREARRVFDGEIIAAEDGMRVPIPPRL